MQIIDIKTADGINYKVTIKPSRIERLFGAKEKTIRVMDLGYIFKTEQVRSLYYPSGYRVGGPKNKINKAVTEYDNTKLPIILLNNKQRNHTAAAIGINGIRLNIECELLYG
jgi:hypothetical protein